MSDSRALILTITRLEADYLADLVGQFISQLDEYSDERAAPAAPSSAGAGAVGAVGVVERLHDAVEAEPQPVVHPEASVVVGRSCGLVVRLRLDPEAARHHQANRGERARPRLGGCAIEHDVERGLRVGRRLG